jgi:hypothetical protein
MSMDISMDITITIDEIFSTPSNLYERLIPIIRTMSKHDSSLSRNFSDITSGKDISSPQVKQQLELLYKQSSDSFYNVSYLLEELSEYLELNPDIKNFDALKALLDELMQIYQNHNEILAKMSRILYETNPTQIEFSYTGPIDELFRRPDDIFKGIIKMYTEIFEPFMIFKTKFEEIASTGNIWTPEAIQGLMSLISSQYVDLDYLKILIKKLEKYLNENGTHPHYERLQEILIKLDKIKREYAKMITEINHVLLKARDEVKKIEKIAMVQEAKAKKAAALAAEAEAVRKTEDAEANAAKADEARAIREAQRTRSAAAEAAARAASARAAAATLAAARASPGNKKFLEKYLKYKNKYLALKRDI